MSAERQQLLIQRVHLNYNFSYLFLLYMTCFFVACAVTSAATAKPAPDKAAPMSVSKGDKENTDSNASQGAALPGTRAVSGGVIGDACIWARCPDLGRFRRHNNELVACPGNSRRGLFTTDEPTPVMNSSLEHEAAGIEPSRLESPVAASAAAPRGDDGDAKGGEKKLDELHKSEAVQDLEKRLAFARKQITPVKSASGAGRVAWGEDQVEEAMALGVNGEATEENEEKSANDAASARSSFAGLEMESQGKESCKETSARAAAVGAVPFARWIASGCPIGTKSRVSGVCMDTNVSTPLAAVRESSGEGEGSSESGSLTIQDLEATVSGSGRAVGDAEQGLQIAQADVDTDGATRETKAEAEVDGEQGRLSSRSSSAQMVHDYLGDRYYTDEERVEIRRELLREMEERKEELEAAVETSSKIRYKKGEVLGAGSFGQVYLGLNEATGELLAVKEVRRLSDLLLFSLPLFVPPSIHSLFPPPPPSRAQSLAL